MPDDLSDARLTTPAGPYRPKHPVRFVTAAALFDGHDASINIIRRMLQASGVEVIHLGHNRSVDEVVEAALQEDVDLIGVSLLSGAHMTIVPRLLDLLRERGADDIVVMVGGVIPDVDIARLQALGVAEVFLQDTPPDTIVAGDEAAVAARRARF